MIGGFGDTGDKMGKGRDLTDPERAFVHNKVMQNWDSELRLM